MLANLLLESRKYSAEYSNQLSNHLPMALIALDHIGATSEQLQKFYDKYTPRLNLLSPASIIITETNWNKFLGRHIYNSEYRDYFLNEVSQNGKKQTLLKYIPELIPGLSGGAFHPLIRLAYALESENNWEVAESLASWCMAYQNLGKLEGASVKESDLLLILEKVSQDKIKKAATLDGENIFNLMYSAASVLNINQLVAQTEINKNSLREIAKASLNIYGKSNDSFTALHCVTVTHAARIVFPFVENPEYFLRYLWQGVVAAYATIDSPFDQPTITVKEITWDEIFLKARNSTNDHVIKFCYTANQEQIYYNDFSYKSFAAIKVGL